MLVLDMVQDLAFALEAKALTHTRQDALQLLHCGKRHWVKSLIPKLWVPNKKDQTSTCLKYVFWTFYFLRQHYHGGFHHHFPCDHYNLSTLPPSPNPQSPKPHAVHRLFAAHRRHSHGGSTGRFGPCIFGQFCGVQISKELIGVG